MRVKGISAAGAAVLLVACAEDPPPTLQLTSVLGDSAFLAAAGTGGGAFFGTFLARPARTTDAVAATRLTTLVRVDSLITWGPAVDIEQADSVTVVVRDTLGLTSNQRYAFVVDGLAIDSGVVLTEMWRTDASTASRRSAFVDVYSRAVALALDRETHDHLSEIDAVFWGSVLAVQQPQVPDSIALRTHSESAPGWRVATIIPRGVLRGSLRLIGQPIRVLFPGTRHVIYAAVPQPRVQQVGLYLLHRPGRPAGRSFAGIDTAGAFVIYDVFDVRPLGDTARVANLLKQRP